MSLLVRIKPSLHLCVRHLGSSPAILAGHNKWSKIKDGKGINDKLKSKIYGKANREIILAARKGGSADPKLNGALATAISKAKSNGVPKANIQSSVDQAQKNKETGAHLDFNYEALFAGKVGLIMFDVNPRECFSDNSTRTLRELRHIVKEHGAQLTAVSFMFQKVARIRVSLHSEQSYRDLFDEVLKGGGLGVDDVETEDAESERRMVDITISPEHCAEIEGFLSTHPNEYDLVESEIVQAPLHIGVALDEETREAARNLIQELEGNPDVHNVRVSPQL